MIVLDMIHTVIEIVTDSIVAFITILNYIRNEKDRPSSKNQRSFSLTQRTTVTGDPFVLIVSQFIMLLRSVIDYFCFAGIASRRNVRYPPECSSSHGSSPFRRSS